MTEESGGTERGTLRTLSVAGDIVRETREGRGETERETRVLTVVTHTEILLWSHNL